MRKADMLFDVSLFPFQSVAVQHFKVIGQRRVTKIIPLLTFFTRSFAIRSCDGLVLLKMLRRSA